MEVTLTFTLPVADAAKVTAFIQNMETGSTAPKMSAVAQTTPTMARPVQQTAPAPNLQQMFPPMQTATIPAQQTVSVPVTQIPVQAPQTAPTIPTQTAQQTYSVQELTVAARPLMEMGRKAELQQLLTEFGVTTLTNLSEDKRPAFAARLRALGGLI